MNIGERIRQLRLHSNKKQHEFLNGITSNTYLSRIENGQIPPSENFLQQISEQENFDISLLVLNEAKKIQEKVLNIADDFWSRKKLNQDDLLFLKMISSENHELEIRIRLFSILIMYYADKDLELSKEYYDLSLSVLPNDSSEELIGAYYYYYRACLERFLHLQDFVKAEDYVNRMEPWAEQMGEKEVAIFQYYLGFLYHHHKQDHTISMQYCEKAYQYFIKMRDTDWVIETLALRGVQQHQNGEYDKSIECMHQLEQLSIQNQKVLENKGFITYYLGLNLRDMGKTEDAISYFKETITVYQNQGKALNMICPHARLSEIYMELKEWSLVDHHLNRAYQMAKEHNIIYSYIELSLLKAKLYKLKLEDAKFEKVMNKLLNYCLREKQLASAKEVAKELGKYYYEKRAFKKAAAFLYEAL
ncbi:helix-turn-helix domain-containing protein [Peribacillus acanthi]|uniref:helix-turn-helix domain-containing protein n=1 Tax=Peribacillus acanthi TaxID=2171554 RepID=UPI000D3E6627|nr:helix-turn-helix transcriptional regulator [Peribacillus acanthi]